MIYMVIGGVLVAALVGWALTRSVTPSATTSVMTDAPVALNTSGSASVPFTGSAPPTPIPTGSDPTNTSFTPPAQFDQHPQDPATAAVARMSAEDLKARVARNAVTVVDVRDEKSYADGHIAGALHIPMARVEGELGYLPKGKEIVTYCT